MVMLDKPLQKKVRTAGGFSLIELIVVISITTMVGSLMLANFKQGQKTQAVRASADAVVSSLREMQNKTLAGEKHPSGQPARAFGWQVVTGNTGQFNTFSEENGPSNKQILETIKLEKNVQISNIVIGSTNATGLEVRFFPPFGAIAMTGASYTEAEDLVVRFDITYPSTSISRRITVDGITGRIESQ